MYTFLYFLCIFYNYIVFQLKNIIKIIRSILFKEFQLLDTFYIYIKTL